MNKKDLPAIALRFGVCLSFYWLFWLYCVTAVTPFIEEITYNNFEISLVVFMPNITTNHAITYTNSLQDWKTRTGILTLFVFLMAQRQSNSLKEHI